MWGLPQRQNARRADKIRLCGHLRRYKKIVKKTYIIYKKLFTQKIQHQEFIHKLDEFIEHHNDEIKDQDEQIMGILKYLTEWLVNHILYVDGQIAEFVSKM